jgi:hypothetical protein
MPSEHDKIDSQKVIGTLNTILELELAGGRPRSNSRLDRGRLSFGLESAPSRRTTPSAYDRSDRRLAERIKGEERTRDVPCRAMTSCARSATSPSN